MPAQFIGSFSEHERDRARCVLRRAGLSAWHVRIAKIVFSPTTMPDGIGEMVTFLHGPVSRTYVSSVRGQWLDQMAGDLAGAASQPAACHGEQGAAYAHPVKRLGRVTRNSITSRLKKLTG